MLMELRGPMQQLRHRYYAGQFSTTPDLLHVTVPQSEILREMVRRGDQETLNDVCLAVAIVADAIAAAQIDG